MTQSDDTPEEQDAVMWPPREIQKDSAVMARGVVIGIGIGSTAVYLAGVYGQAASLIAMVCLGIWSYLKMKKINRDIWSSRQPNGDSQ